MFYKVPQSSASALRGQTAYDVAESKKQRKALDEYKFYKGWEDSLCDVMRAARRGDKDLVMQLIAVSDEQIHYRDSNNGKCARRRWRHSKQYLVLRSL